MKKIKFLLVFLMMIGLLGTASADPIYNTTDVFANGTSYGTYTNSGELLFIEPRANTTPISGVQAALNAISGYDNIVLVEDTAVTITGTGGDTGTWTTNDPTTLINFYAVKAAHAYAFYLVDPATSTGSWSTYDLWLDGYGGNGALDISHLVGYNPSTAVPEPSTMLLLGLGLIGVAGVRRKFNK